MGNYPSEGVYVCYVEANQTLTIESSIVSEARIVTGKMQALDWLCNKLKTARYSGFVKSKIASKFLTNGLFDKLKVMAAIDGGTFKVTMHKDNSDSIDSYDIVIKRREDDVLYG